MWHWLKMEFCCLHFIKREGNGGEGAGALTDWLTAEKVTSLPVISPEELVSLSATFLIYFPYASPLPVLIHII